MDIKLKRFRGNILLKVLAFILCVVFFISSLVGMGLSYRAFDSGSRSFSGDINDILRYSSYEESTLFQREFSERLDAILFILDEYKSQEYIKSGKSINQEELEQAIENLFHEKNASGDYQYEYNVSESINGTDTSVPIEEYGGDYNLPAVREAFKKNHAEEIALLKENLIMDDLREMEYHDKRLSGKEGFTYYATDGTYVITNLKDSGATVSLKEFNSKPAYLIYENDNLTKVPASGSNANDSTRYFDEEFERRLDDAYNKDLKVYFAFDSKYLAAKEDTFALARAEMMRWLPMAIISGLLSLAALIFLIVVTGRKDEEGNRPICKIDKIFTEIQLMVIGLCLFAGGAGFLNFLFDTVNYGVSYNGNIYYSNNPMVLSAILATIIGLSSASVGLAFILSCVRNLKAGRFLKNSLICKVIMAIYNGIKAIYHGGSVMAKVVLITLAISLFSASVVGAPIVILLVIIFAPKWVKKYNEIKKGVDEVKSGNLAYKIPLNGEGELDQLAKGINEISEASNIAIQNELKNQRLKTDLISNVSHDLKTPLTSILTYIDILKKEGLDSADAPKYLDILDQKSQRLRKLTEDLFDAAKASSGAIPVKFEKVEMLSLINQGLGEMADKIEASGLEFKINASKEKYYVNADGQLLWRVVENLLGNVLKYAQEGSRVYIDLKERGGTNGKTAMVVLEMKNISKMELNIDEEELMERFKRGDESRTTEGSGLGLAIAKDLIRLQNGWFEIKIDGDLFKAVVTLEAQTQSHE